MENKCPMCFGGSSCNLKEQLKSQGENGGSTEKNLDRTKGGGPFWPETSWNGFAERVKKAADEGCLHPDEVKKLADKITADKKKAGELI